MVFIFDANYSHRLAEGLKLLEDGNKKSPYKIKNILHVDDLKIGNPSDEELIVHSANKDVVILTMDTDFKRIKHYHSLYKKYSVGAIFFKIPKKVDYWSIVIDVIKHWELIKEKVLSDQVPFAYELNNRGFVKLIF